MMERKMRRFKQLLTEEDIVLCFQNCTFDIPDTPRTNSSNSAVLEGALDKVAQLVPRQFTPSPISARRTTFYGFLSGEMESVLPELVSGDDEGGKYINYVELIPILTKAIQDLTLKVSEQQERIDQLEQSSNLKIKP